MDSRQRGMTYAQSLMLAVAALGVGAGISLPDGPMLPDRDRIRARRYPSLVQPYGRTPEQDEASVADAEAKRERKAAKRVAQALRTERAAAKGASGH